MKIVIKSFIILCLLSISLVASAHQPDVSSTILVEQGENKWVLQVRSALTAFEYEIENQFGKSSYASPEEFRALVIKHVQENTSILSNEDSAIELKNGMVKLGHETSVTFEVVGMPDALQSLLVTNSSFGDISRNQSALMVVKKGFSKNQFMLNGNNNHTVQLKISGSTFELVTPSQEKTQFSTLIFIGIGLLIISSILWLVFKNKRNTIVPTVLTT